MISTAICQIIIERRSLSFANFLRQTNSSFQNTVTRKGYYSRGNKNDKLRFASIYHTRKFCDSTNFIFVNLFQPFDISFIFYLHNLYHVESCKNAKISDWKYDIKKLYHIILILNQCIIVEQSNMSKCNMTKIYKWLA